jgi:hypothetical protein
LWRSPARPRRPRLVMVPLHSLLRHNENGANIQRPSRDGLCTPRRLAVVRTDRRNVYLGKFNFSDSRKKYQVSPNKTTLSRVREPIRIGGQPNPYCDCTVILRDPQGLLPASLSPGCRTRFARPLELGRLSS